MSLYMQSGAVSKSIVVMSFCNAITLARLPRNIPDLAAKREMIELEERCEREQPKSMNYGMTKRTMGRAAVREMGS